MITVTGLHDMDEFVQSQLILAVSSFSSSVYIQFISACSLIIFIFCLVSVKNVDFRFIRLCSMFNSSPFCQTSREHLVLYVARHLFKLCYACLRFRFL
jgi:hypothetical protein